MRRKTLIMVFAMVFVLSAVLVGCGGGGGGDTTPEEKTKIIMITDEGGIDDQSFNQSAWDGIKKLEAEYPNKVEVSFIESTQQSEYKPNLETAASQGANIICAVGFMMTKNVLEAAQANPEINYIAVDIAFEDDDGNPIPIPSNVITVNFKAEEGSFLVGYIAAKTSKSKTVGFVGGVDSPLINAFQFGYEAGVKYGDKSINILSQYVGNFSDAAAGKQIATGFFTRNADVVYHAAGACGEGVIEAAKEQGEGKWAIGVDKDQNELAPDSVLTSAMKEVGFGIYNAVKESLDEGKFEGGRNINYGLKENGVGIAPSSDKNVDAEILKEVEDITKKIVDGEIKVPTTKAEYDAFVAALP